MDKVLISNAQGESGIVNVVRYFRANGVDYLIYSLNEVDENGYTRLYVAKLSNIGVGITADSVEGNEWDQIKNYVKLIIKANKEGLPIPVEDMDASKLNNVFLKDKKVFKLNAPLVTDLGKNRPTFAGSENVSNGMNMNQDAVPTGESLYGNNIPGNGGFNVPEPNFQTGFNPQFGNINADFKIPEPAVNPVNSQMGQQSFGNFDSVSTSIPEVSTPNMSVNQGNTNPSSFDELLANSTLTGNYNVSNVNQPVQENTVDYKALYESEMQKCQNLENENMKLNEEIKKYTDIISNIKNVLNN